MKETMTQAADMAQALASMAAEIHREMSMGGESATLAEMCEMADMAAELADMLADIEED